MKLGWNAVTNETWLEYGHKRNLVGIRSQMKLGWNKVTNETWLEYGHK